MASKPNWPDMDTSSAPGSITEFGVFKKPLRLDDMQFDIRPILHEVAVAARRRGVEALLNAVRCRVQWSNQCFPRTCRCPHPPSRRSIRQLSLEGRWPSRSQNAFVDEVVDSSKTSASLYMESNPVKVVEVTTVAVSMTLKNTLRSGVFSLPAE